MSFRFVIRSAGALALVAAVAPCALPAQQYVQTLQGYMNNYSQPVLNSGFQAVTQMVTGGINNSATGTHPVTLNAGRQYVIIGVCDDDCQDLDLRLNGPDGSQVASDFATDDHPTLRFTAPQTGSYRLDVVMANCRQNPCYYGVQLFGGGTGGGVAMNQPQPMNMGGVGPTMMGTIAANQQVTGNLTSMDGRFNNKPMQAWNFACQAGQAFQMDILSSWDNYAVVLDPMGNQVATDDDTGEGLNARINYTCLTAGIYRLGITTYQSGTTPGQYTLQVQSMGAVAMNQPMPMNQPQPMAAGAVGGTAMGQIQANQQVSGNLTAMDGRFNNKPMQSWAFACQAGQAFQMDILSTWDNYAVVLDPMGNQVATDDDSGEGLNARITYTCTVTGVYRLGISTYQSSTTPGAYTLQVQSQTAMGPQPMAAPMAAAPMAAAPQAAPGATMPQAAPVSLPITGGIPAPGQTGQITAGTNVQGRLETGDMRMNDGTWADVWTFQGQAGQHVIIELRSEEFDTYLQLMDAQDNKLAEDDDSLGDLDSKVEFNLPATGMYKIVVNNFSDERRAGIYTLTLR